MLTPEERQERKKFIGSSDASAIVGYNPYMTAHDVWLDKTYPTFDIDNPAIEIGDALEPAILDWGAAKLGVKIVKKPPVCVHPNGVMASRRDADTKGLKEAWEAKANGVLSYRTKEWGDIESDEVPFQFNIQGQVHLACAGPEWKVCHYPALLGGRGLCLFHVERDDSFIESLEILLMKFWKDHVLAGVPPTNSSPTMEMVKRIIRVPDKPAAKIDSTLVLKWNQAKEALKEAKGAADEAQARVIAALGDAEAGECDLGTVTYYEQFRKGYVVDPTSFRVARFTKAKGAKKNAA